MSARQWAAVVLSLLALPVVATWNYVIRVRKSTAETEPTADTASPDARIVEHERGWVTYICGFDAHHGPDGSNDAPPSVGSFWRGLRLWVGSSFLRGYTLGNDVYVCPATPRPVRVHQAGHTPAFGAVFDPLADELRADGGLPDEPLSTADIMLPGSFPHTFLRLRDPRGLRGAYRAWLHDGVIVRVVD